MFKQAYKRLKNWVKVQLFTINAEKIADKLYLRSFGRHINWEKPTEFNEKIRVIQFKTDTSLWIKLADKFRVREYIEEKGYGHTLVKLYGSYDKVSDIKFDVLPKSFVLKTNNGCGDVIIVNDVNKIDKVKLLDTLENNLISVFGLNSAEIHYSKIKSCIIAEEKLENDAEFSNCLVDYKFYCFHGEPLMCGVFYDRLPNSHQTNHTFYDMNWIRHDEWKSPSAIESKDIPRPAKLEEMIEMCHVLAKDIPFVRLDLYYVNNQIYFGEFTFTPAACSGGSLNPAILEHLGSFIKM